MSDPAPLSRAPLPHLAILGLGLTQIISWGSTYYVPSVLAPNFRADLGLSQQEIFGGITLMQLVGAAAAPYAGRVIERQGARGALMLGSVLMAVALVVLSRAEGLLSYGLAWIVVGIAAPIGLSQAALSALAQIAGEGARRAISRLLLITGFAATVFWPLTMWSEGWIGWRSTCLLFAAVHALLCLPVHAYVVPSFKGRSGLIKPAASAGPARPLTPRAETTAMVLSAIAFSLAGFVSSGLGIQIVELLAAFGHPAETAVAVGALVGPAAVAARIGEATLGQRMGVFAVGVAALVAMPLALAMPLLGDASVAIAAAFVIGYGMSAGAMTIVRSVLPLTLFGRDRYARLLGSLAAPQNVVFALAPMIFAGVMSHYGPRAVLQLSIASAVLALIAIIWLARVARPPAAPQG